MESTEITSQLPSPLLAQEKPLFEWRCRNKRGSSQIVDAANNRIVLLGGETFSFRGNSFFAQVTTGAGRITLLAKVLGFSSADHRNVIVQVAPLPATDLLCLGCKSSFSAQKDIFHCSKCADRAGHSIDY
jgi:hypothetical protein